MYAFRYHRPESLAEASRLFDDCEDPRYLAGGHTLLPAMKLRLSAPSDLIDIAGIDALRGIAVGDRSVVVGAGVRHGDVARSTAIGAAIPALGCLAGRIGDVQVRNRGTLGGTVANADPAADYPAAVLGLGATVVTDRRRIDGDGFFRGPFETALDKGEIVTSLVFETPRRAAYMKFPSPASSQAIVGVLVAETLAGIRVAVTGAGPCVFRVAQMEEALARDFRPDAIAGISIAEDGLNSDIHAQADYRAHLVTVMAQRAVARALPD